MKRIFYILSFFLIISCDDIIEVPDISNETVSVLAPTDGVILTSTSVTFNWNAIENAENYRLQIATPTFAEAQQIVTDSLTSDLSFTTILEVGSYQWRVRAENSDYQTVYTSQSFTIEE